MQSDFVRLVVRGLPLSEAARQAGYVNPDVAGAQIMHSAAVQAAVYAGVQRQLQADAGVNLRVLRKIRDDEGAPARVRADIGLKLLQLSGHTVPTTQEGKAQKALSDMTRDEMVAFIEQNQAAIDRAEQELMSRAKDVSVQDSVPIEQGIGDKPIEYLD